MSTSSMAMMAATMNVPTFVSDAKIGTVISDWQARSPLAALLMPGENVALATLGNDGSALFTATRLLVGEEAGLLTKRLVVKAIRRSAIDAFAIDKENKVTLALRGAGFGVATLVFEDENFDPMQLTMWLGQTLDRIQTEESN